MSDIREFRKLSNEFRKAFRDAFKLYGLDPDQTGLSQKIYNIHLDGVEIDTGPYEDALFEIWRNGYEQGKLMERGSR